MKHRFIVGLMAVALITAATAACPYSATLLAGTTKITAEVVSSRADLVKGLGEKIQIPANAGMLFDYKIPDRHGIWMKDMKFSIDILWLDNNLTILDLQRDVTPETFPHVYYPIVPDWFVLELNAGTIKRLGLHPGQKLINLNK